MCDVYCNFEIPGNWVPAYSNRRKPIATVTTEAFYFEGIYGRQRCSVTVLQSHFIKKFIFLFEPNPKYPLR